MGKYYCRICDKKSMQKSHHEAHLKSESHKDKRKISKLELLNDKKFIKFTNKKKMNEEEREKYVESVLDERENSTTEEEIIMDSNPVITNKHILKEWIHDVHNFLRNSGAGYGMKPLNIFSLFYGLMRLEEYDMLGHFGLTDNKMKFSHLVKLSNESKSEGEGKLSELYDIIRVGDDSILERLYGTSDDHPLRDVLFYEIPKHITGSIFAELILKINEIKNIEKQSNLQLSGKVYEYFIGRDESAISALGAFFTDRPIPRLI